MDKVKVLHAIRQGKTGGGESHLIDLVEGLPEYVESFVLSFTEGEMVDHFREKGVPVFVIPSLRGFDTKVWGEVQKLIAKLNVDFVHAHGTRAATNLFWPTRKQKLKMIYTVHGWSFHQDQPWLVRNIRITSERLITRLAKYVINVSEANKITGQKHFNLDNAVVIENGVNTSNFDPNKSYNNIRGEFNIPDETFLIGYIARITKQKDPFTFLKSIKVLKEKLNNFKVLMIGSGELKEQSEAMIDELGLRDVIISQDFRQDVPHLLAAVDVFCLPSLWEGLSLSLLEAMSMAKGIVATPTDGTRELIEDGVNGSIIPFEDPVKLADAFANYGNNRNLIAEHGMAARDIIIKGYSAQLMCDQVAELYKKMVS